MALAAAQAAVLAWYGSVVLRARRVTDFIQIGSRWATPFGTNKLATSAVGYDGQWFYYIARFPGQHLLAIDPAWHAVAYRYGRILYPLLIWFASLGRASAMPYAMLAINVVAIALTTVLLAQMLAARSERRTFALIALLYAGQLLALFRDLADPLALLFVVLTLWFLQRKQWVAAAVACAAALLTRETAIGLVAGLGLVTLKQLPLSRTVGIIAIASAPFVAWHAVLQVWMGSIGTGPGGLIVSYLAQSRWPQWGRSETVVLVIVAVVPMAISLAFAVRLIGNHWKSANDPVAVCAAVFVVVSAVMASLVIVTPTVDVWAVVRVAAPLVIMIPLILPRRGGRLFGDAALALGAISMLLTLVLVT